jgi:hypothetical protein
MTEKINIKKELFKACMRYVEERIHTFEQAISEAKESAEAETKSTAGDKHDTAKAMSHLEQEKNSVALMESLELKRILDTISTERIGEVVSLGSVIKTDAGNFYLAISAGKMMVGEELYIAVSPQAPLAKAFLNRKAKEEVVFNRNYKIIEVF